MTRRVPFLGEEKESLRASLDRHRDVVLWKIEGLDDDALRRPMTPSGTSLLGLVKHLASVEFGYFGETFGRPSGEELPWVEDGAEPNADMWATAGESREQIVELYHRAWAHADATIDALDLDEAGLAQPVLEDGGADRALVDNHDFERGIARSALRLRAIG